MKTLNYLIILLCFFISTQALAKNEIKIVEGSSLFIGTLQGHKACKGEEAQVFFVHQNVVNYQIPVPDKGSFQVHLIPGQYHLVAIDEGGCLAETRIEVEANKVHQYQFKMEKVSEVSLIDLLSLIFPEAHAMTMCIQCLQGAQTGIRPMHNPYFGGYPQQRFGYPTPFWGPFGHFSFNRFSSPCPMGGLYPGAYAVLKKEQEKGRAPASMLAGGMPPMGGGFSAGCMGPRYPGTGPMVMGKPNIYFYSPEKKKVKFKININESGNLLATTPVIHEQGMEFEIDQSGGLTHQSAKHPYFFYDLRTDSKKVQQSAGKCVKSKDVVKTMVDYLKAAGFNEKEQKDFYSYWNVKLPKLPTVCIYPQTNENLNELSNIEIKPKPEHYTRLVFMLVPIIKGKTPEKLFTKVPQKDWRPNAKLRAPASSNYVVREWGVGFLTVPEVTNKIVPPKFRKIKF